MLTEGPTASWTLRVAAEMTPATGGHDGVDIFAAPPLLCPPDNTCVQP